MRVLIESPDMLRLENHFRYLSNYMVAEEMREARNRSAVYAAAGGRKRDPATRRYRSTYGRRRLTRVSGVMIAWMAEKCFYRRFVDFWNTTPQ
jgi:hypothetical protein